MNKCFIHDFGMSFGLYKCLKVTYMKENYRNPLNRFRFVPQFRDLEQEKVSKFRGVSQEDEIQQTQMMDTVWKEYSRRVRLVFNTDLNSQDRISAITFWLFLQYIFNILNWIVVDFKRMNFKTRKLQTCHRMQHHTADVDRLCVKMRRT